MNHHLLICMTFTNVKENTCTNIYGDFKTFIIYKKQLVTELII